MPPLLMRWAKRFPPRKALEGAYSNLYDRNASTNPIFSVKLVDNASVTRGREKRGVTIQAYYQNSAVNMLSLWQIFAKSAVRLPAVSPNLV